MIQKTDSGDHEMVKNPVTESQSKMIPDAQSDKILQKMTEPICSFEMLGAVMDSSVQNLEDKIQRKKDHENLEEQMIVKMKQGFKNEENA